MDRKTLQDAHCWFAVDHVSGDQEMTAFKRQARYHQAQWRQAQQIDIGGHRNSTRGIEAGGPEVILSGSKMSAGDGERGRNFLSDEIRTAVEKRLAAPQPGQTLDTTRLKQDLLSSMPMCFNLFGEAATDPARARDVADLLMPGPGTGPVEIIFEWSPERASARYTNDRTAFDCQDHEVGLR